MSYLSKAISAFERFAVRMDSGDWTIAAVVMMVIGVVCMRGLKGKTNF